MPKQFKANFELDFMLVKDMKLTHTSPSTSQGAHAKGEISAWITKDKDCRQMG
jgi:hypothetical protein